MRNLDQSIVEKIIEEKCDGVKNKIIAQTANVSVRYVQILWRRYKDKSDIQYPKPMGRPANGLFGRREHSAVLSAAQKKCSGARILEDVIEFNTGVHIPHGDIHVTGEPPPDSSTNMHDIK